MIVNNFDVMKAMSAENKDIRLAPLDNVTNLQKTKAGTLITIGAPGDLVAAIGVHRQFVGGLILADKIQFNETKERLSQNPTREQAQSPETDQAGAESGGGSGLLRNAPEGTPTAAAAGAGVTAGETALREIERLAATAIGRFHAACGGRHFEGRTCDYCLIDDILRVARAAIELSTGNADVAPSPLMPEDPRTEGPSGRSK
jgi:hypothetical protein